LSNKLNYFFIKQFRYIQIFIVHSAYFISKIFNRKHNTQWVIGTNEIASMIFLVKNILSPSISVSLSKNKYYDLKYDYSINIKNKYLCFIYRVIYAPVLLGFLASRSTHFFYIWQTGFLLNREDEFKFLKSKNKKIVCLFVGNDIRSLVLTENYRIEHKIDLWGTYDKHKIDKIYDLEKIQVAKIADKFANLIFGAPMDQISYLKSKQFAWRYAYSKNNFFKNNNKFNNISRIKILHAPTSPINKGTPLVRAAIKKLEIEGYHFDYVELQDIANDLVLEHLRNTHIVLNQFYAFAPGMFGIESMANHCAVLMSADPSIETTLPQDSKDAWMITRYWEVYDNLKYLLDNPKKIKYYADNGYDFAYKHYTYEAAGEYINKVLKETGVID
jgi:hypothetical protein